MIAESIPTRIRLQQGNRYVRRNRQELFDCYQRVFVISQKGVDVREVEDIREPVYGVFRDRKQLHNFKYFTWVEQQGKTPGELRQLWDPDFWDGIFSQIDQWDELIRAFNAETGLLEAISD